MIRKPMPPRPQSAASSKVVNTPGRPGMGTSASSSTDVLGGYLSNNRQQKLTSQISTTHTGSTATVVLNPLPPQQVQPGGLSLSLPPDLQDKIGRWREKRMKKEGSTAANFTLIDEGDGYVQESDGSAVASGGGVGESTPSSVVAALSALPVLSAQVGPLTTAIPEHGELLVPLSKGGSAGLASPPVASSAPADKPAAATLFTDSAQEVIKMQVEYEVTRCLDRLKKERPELINQSEVMNLINQKTRKLEESLQQYNIREQRLRDSVDQLGVSVKAVQSNVDRVNNESGGSVLTEESMRSWVPFFFNEQMTLVKAELRGEMAKVEGKIGPAVAPLKTLESAQRLLDAKFQNTLQNIFEAVCFVYGSVLEPVTLYEKPDVKSAEVRKAKVGEKLLLLYPIFRQGDDRWMKAKLVDPETAQLSEAWVPIYVDDTIYVGHFKMM